MLLRKMNIPIRRLILILLLGGFLAWVLFTAWVHISYASNLPEAPDAKAGRVYKMMVNHGFVRYGTERELHTLRWAENSFAIATAAFFSAVVLGLRWGIFHIRVGRKLLKDQKD